MEIKTKEKSSRTLQPGTVFNYYHDKQGFVGTFLVYSHNYREHKAIRIDLDPLNDGQGTEPGEDASFGKVSFLTDDKGRIDTKLAGNGRFIVLGKVIEFVVE